MKSITRLHITPKTRDIIIICIMLLIVGLSNIIWLSLDQRPPAWDQSTHFLLAMDYSKALWPPDVWRILTISNFYPPLFHLSLVPMITLINSVDGAVLTNMLYLSIALFSIYGLGSILFKPSVGVLSAVMFCFFPFVQLMGRECMIDLALTSSVCLAYYCLVRSHNFNSNKYTAAFMCASAAGMLIKWNFIFYLFVPFVVCIVLAYSHNRRKAYLALCGTVILCSPWYLVNLPIIVQKGIRYIAIGSAEGDPNIFTLKSLLWYPLSLGEQVYQPIAALCIVSIVLLCIRYQKGKWILFTWIGVPLLLHTFMSNKDIRYTLPVLPVLALILSLWLLRDGQKKKIKVLMVSSVVVILFFQSLHASYGMPSIMRNLSFRIFDRSQIILRDMSFQKHDWKHAEIFKAFSEIYPSPNKTIRVSVVSNHPYVHGASLRTFAEIHHLSFNTRGYKGRLGELSPIILYKTNKRGPLFSLGKINQAAEVIDDTSSWFHDSFKQFAVIPLPDGSDARIYQLSVKPADIPAFAGIQMRFNTIRYRKFLLTGADLSVVQSSEQAARQGAFKRIHVAADSLQYKGFELNDLVVNFENVHIDLNKFIEKQELFFLDCDVVELSVRLREQSLITYLEKKAPWIKDARITMENDEIKFAGKAYGIPISFKIRMGVKSAEKILWTKLSNLNIMHMRIPMFLYAALTNRDFSLQSGKDLQFNLALKQTVITEGSVIIQ